MPSMSVREDAAASPLSWYGLVWKRAMDFGGRSRRKEYWWFSLINLIVIFVMMMIDATIMGQTAGGIGIFYLLYVLFSFVPSLSLTIRRLHDVGKSGWWILIGLIPLLGILIFFLFAIRDSEPFTNRYGPNPKDPIGDLASVF